MLTIKMCPLPERALLERYNNRSDAFDAVAYTDCFSVDISGTVVLSDYVFAFYTTPLFRLERVILAYLVNRPSTDGEAEKLSNGSIGAFAAWTVEDRSHNQLLMCDVRERTRSWFMVSPTMLDDKPGTKLFFGSAVVPIENTKSGEIRIGMCFNLLLKIHKLYSILLLSSAKKRLGRSREAAR